MSASRQGERVPEEYSNETVVQILLRTEQAVKALETKLDDQRAEYVSHAIWVQRNNHVDHRLTALEAQLTWLWRTVIGLVLAAVAALLVGGPPPSG